MKDKKIFCKEVRIHGGMLKPPKGGTPLQPVRPERNYLIRLLSSVIETVQPPNPPEEMDWERLYRLSARHGVSNMAHKKSLRPLLPGYPGGQKGPAA